MSVKDHSTNDKLLAVYEHRSTCVRLQVAAVIVKEGRAIASGWNGVPFAAAHCTTVFADASPEHIKNHHHAFSNMREIHAEANAIGFAAKHGIATEGTDIYVTYSPCLSCAKLIKAAGIKNVFYREEYDRDSEGITFLTTFGVPAIKMEN